MGSSACGLASRVALSGVSARAGAGMCWVPAAGHGGAAGGEGVTVNHLLRAGTGEVRSFGGSAEGTAGQGESLSLPTDIQQCPVGWGGIRKDNPGLNSSPNPTHMPQPRPVSSQPRHQRFPPGAKAAVFVALPLLGTADEQPRAGCHSLGSLCRTQSHISPKFPRHMHPMPTPSGPPPALLPSLCLRDAPGIQAAGGRPQRKGWMCPTWELSCY